MDQYTSRSISPESDITKTEFSEINEIEFFRNSSLRFSKNLRKHSEFSMENPFKNKFRKSDFEIIGLVGRGAYGIVVKAKHKATLEIYSIKIINKDNLKNRIHHVYAEGEILKKLNHPNIIHIYDVFEEDSKVYIVLEFCENGNLAEFLENNHPLPFETSRHILAQLVNCLEYLHVNRIIHRDLKPENIMFDKKMNLKLIDFGTAKLVGCEFKLKINDVEENLDNSVNNGNTETKNISQKKSTFVASAEYVSPEMLKNNQVGFESDLWAFGCIVYLIFYGKSPFHDKTEFLIFRNISELNYKVDNSFPCEAACLIKNILKLDPKSRLGVNFQGIDYFEIKNHPFFKGIKFKNLNGFEIPNRDLLKIKAFFKENKVGSSYIKNKFRIKKSLINTNKIILEGLFEKKSPWFHYNTRKLCLYEDKLQYIDPEKNMIKGEINFNTECKTFLKKNGFEIHTQKRIYVFKSNKKESIIQWVKEIERLTN